MPLKWDVHRYFNHFIIVPLSELNLLYHIGIKIKIEQTLSYSVTWLSVSFMEQLDINKNRTSKCTYKSSFFMFDWIIFY